MHLKPSFSIHMNIPEMSPYIPSISEDIIVLTKAFLSNKCCHKASCPKDCGHIQPWLNPINFSEVMTGINMDLFLAPQAFCTFKSIRCHWSQYRICKSPIRSADICYHFMEEPSRYKWDQAALFFFFLVVFPKEELLRLENRNSGGGII